MKKISPQDLIMSEAYSVQVDTIKGFTYLDNVGAIINSFYKDKVPPTLQSNSNEIIILNPDAGISQIKINSLSIWASLQSSFDKKATIERFAERVKSISKIIDTHKFSRIGIRQQYIYVFSNEAERKKYFESIINIKDFSSLAFTLTCEIEENFLTKINVYPAEKIDTNEKAICVDSDIYTNNLVVSNDLKKTLVSISDKFPGSIEKIIG